jgi:uracil-DNA glycosylase
MTEEQFSLFDELTPEWQDALSAYKPQFAEISQRLSLTASNPVRGNIFRAISQPMELTKVVIVGQDPYPNAEDACGLAFSVPNLPGRTLPPTLRNILTELEADVGNANIENGDLSPWQGQGVVLLNRILTTRPGESLAHKDWGWQAITNAIVERLSSQGAIFILWGRFAQELSPLIPSRQRIESVHPSPLSAYRGFFGSKPFSRANRLLQDNGLPPIRW